MSLSKTGITILDPTMEKGDVRVIKNPDEILGFNIKNETGHHLFIEIKWKSGSRVPDSSQIDIEGLVIRSDRPDLPRDS